MGVQNWFKNGPKVGVKVGVDYRITIFKKLWT